jgi:hypothetical protein
MRRLLLTTILSFAFLVSAHAQLQPSVVLTGRISETYRENFNDYVIWKAKLMMEFTNRGLRPVILINPTLSFGTGLKELNFHFKSPFLQANAKESIGFTARVAPRTDEADALLRLAKQLDDSSPPNNLVVILKPGESFPFSDSFVVSQSYFYNVTDQTHSTANRWDGSMDDNSCLRYLERHEAGCPLNFASSLTIKYEFDLSQFRENPILLSQLNTRWRDYGQIPITGESTITIRSEPITVYPIEWITLVDPNIWHWDQPAEYDPDPIANFRIRP